MASAAASAGARAAGCYKCGKTGHWSRDCTADPSAWVKKPAGDAGHTKAPGSNGAAAAGDFTDMPSEGNENKPTRKGTKRPKLTIDDLKTENGLPYVYNTFPEVYRKQYKGKGHEAGDLRRFLEMYQRWHKRIFPHGSFDDFSERLEKLGSTMIMRGELKDLRKGAMSLTEDKDEDDGGWAAGGGLAGTLGPAEATPPPAPATGGAGAEEDDDLFMDPSLWEDGGGAGDDLDEGLEDMLMDAGGDNRQAKAPAPAPAPASGSSLTSEEKARMEENRRRAMELVQQRRRERAEAEAAAVGPSDTPAVVEPVPTGAEAVEAAGAAGAGAEAETGGAGAEEPVEATQPAVSAAEAGGSAGSWDGEEPLCSPVEPTQPTQC